MKPGFFVVLGAGRWGRELVRLQVIDNQLIDIYFVFTRLIFSRG